MRRGRETAADFSSKGMMDCALISEALDKLCIPVCQCFTFVRPNKTHSALGKFIEFLDLPPERK